MIKTTISNAIMPRRALVLMFRFIKKLLVESDSSNLFHKLSKSESALLSVSAITNFEDGEERFVL